MFKLLALRISQVARQFNMRFKDKLRKLIRIVGFKRANKQDMNIDMQLQLIAVTPVKFGSPFSESGPHREPGIRSNQYWPLISSAVQSRTMRAIRVPAEMGVLAKKQTV